MTFAQIIVSQLADPFRIVLIIGLVYTMFRTRAQTGTVLPLVLGVGFVAAMLPLTMQTHSPEPMFRLIGAGLVSNSVILGIVLGVWSLIRRLRG